MATETLRSKQWALLSLLAAGCTAVSADGRGAPPVTLPSAAPIVAPARTRPATSPATLKRYDFVRPKMGTVFNVVIYAPTAAQAHQAADAAYARVDELNAALSDYDPNSELSRLGQQTNDGPMAAPVPVSDDLWRLLNRAVEASKDSDGLFDVTVGPFVRLWRRARDIHKLPTPERIEATRASVGYQHVRLLPDQHAVQLLAPRMRLDVGGIGKGYTADQALAAIEACGLHHAMVGAAGDISLGDPPPGHAAWRIAIQSLQSPGEVAGYIRVGRGGVSTSGDTYRYVEIDGTRYSHIVDPRTGLGLTRRIGVTVVAPNATTSDWMTKPVSLLGPEAGIAWIERNPGIAVRIVTLESEAGAETAAVYESARFKALGFEPLAPGATRPARRPTSEPTSPLVE